MIKKRLFIPLTFFIVCLLCFSMKGAEQLRVWVIGVISPSKGKPFPIETTCLKRLEAENQMLWLQVDQLKKWLLEEERLGEQYALVSEKAEDSFFKRRQQHLKQILDKQLHAIPAQVIFREPAAWSSTVWLNVGKRNNEALGFEVIAKNSPVVLGKAVVGVVETVAETKCRVRLISDRQLTPSVRAIRKGEQDQVLSNQLASVIRLLSEREDLYGAEEVARALVAFQEQLDVDGQALYLAKGELHGSSAPLWRVPGNTLKGVGFNYDFGDEEGPARDLRTGAYAEGQDPLIKVGDLLVTTGVDGIFPPDLHVGVVSKIFPLHEGGCSYDLEAKSLVSDLNRLSEVFVLPPL